MLIPLTELRQKYGVVAKTVLHIGACHGEEAESYMEYGATEVIWIEADPEVYETLADKIKEYKGHTAINACIHETEGLEIDFNVSNNLQSSSIYRFGTHSEAHPDVHFVKTIKVTTSRADRYVKEAPDMLNLDIQGAELLALKGMAWLNDVKYIYCEVNEKELYKGCARIGEIDEYLDGFGFYRAGTKWYGDTDYHGWGDAIYLKK